jgi:hypothetical protein
MSCVHGAVASIYYQISYGGTSLLLLLYDRNPSLLPKSPSTSLVGTAPLVQNATCLLIGYFAFPSKSQLQD